MRSGWMLGAMVFSLCAACGSSDSGGGTAGSGGGAGSGTGGAGTGGNGVGGAGTGGNGVGGAAGGGTGGSGTGGVAGTGTGGSGSGGVAGTGTGGSGTGGAAGSGGNILTPLPPAGTTQCGSGVFTAAEQQTTCSSPPTVGSLHPSYPAQCSLATTGGGQWETWCTATGVSYVWVLFHDVALSQSCSYFAPDFTFSHQELAYGATGESGNPYEAKPFTSSSFSSKAQDVGMHFDISGGANASKTGGGQIWIAADGSCGSPIPNDVKATFLSFAFTWSG
ncbi:MAG: hypothetical protein H6717_30675 [Polyangiaceae bacterium]|nr:hypothetical protein [Polyangiaceae bacterium]